jgi:hypothetical protein
LDGSQSIHRISVTVAALASDRNIVLAGVSAVAAHGWALSDVDGWRAHLEPGGYLSEIGLADFFERYKIEPDDAGQVVLRPCESPWPFPPQLRLAPAVVAALDLAEAHRPSLATVGRRARLAELENAVEPSWPGGGEGLSLDCTRLSGSTSLLDGL